MSKPTLRSDSLILTLINQCLLDDSPSPKKFRTINASRSIDYDQRSPLKLPPIKNNIKDTNTKVRVMKMKNSLNKFLNPSPQYLPYFSKKT